MATQEVLDIDAYLADQAKPLETEYQKIDKSYQEFLEARQKLAIAIHRLTGEFPLGYGGSPQNASQSATQAPRATRGRRSDPDRAGKVMAMIGSYPDGTTAVAVAKVIGVSNATATKTIKELADSGQIHFVGSGPARKIVAGPPT